MKKKALNGMMMMMAIPPPPHLMLRQQLSIYLQPNSLPFPASSLKRHFTRNPSLISAHSSPLPIDDHSQPLLPFNLAFADPPNSRLSDIIWPAAGAFGAMAVMAAIDTHVLERLGVKMSIAPFGAVCTVLFAAPHTPAAKKYNMFMAHIGCATIGVIAAALLGYGWIARSVALAASLAFMQCTGSIHPPAAGLPLLFLDAPKFQHLGFWYALFPGAAGCILLCLLQEVVSYLKKNCRF